jgi:hypothetical protein
MFIVLPADTPKLHYVLRSLGAEILMQQANTLSRPYSEAKCPNGWKEVAQNISVVLIKPAFRDGRMREDLR